MDAQSYYLTVLWKKNCSSNNPCGTNRCSCKLSSLPCTTYCKCIADTNCHNEYTVSTASFENEYEIDDI